MKVRELKNIKLSDIARNYMDILINYQQDYSEAIKTNHLIVQKKQEIDKYDGEDMFFGICLWSFFVIVTSPILFPFIISKILSKTIWLSSLECMFYALVIAIIINSLILSKKIKSKLILKKIEKKFQIIPQVSLKEDELKFLNDELEEQKEIIEEYSIIKKQNHRYIIDNNHAIDVTNISTKKDDTLLKIKYYRIVVEKKSYQDYSFYEYDDILVEEVNDYIQKYGKIYM